MNLRDPSSLANDPLLKRVWRDMGRPARCRVVGGYVRDRLLGRPSNDLDLAIDGDDRAAEVPARRLAAALGVRAHLLGTAPHRVWRLEVAALKIEIWPLGEIDREADIRRRDFACNALAWELPGGPLVDLTGGLADLEHGRLRAVSRANLADDPVRLLRAPRFIAQLPDFDLDRETRRWIVELAPSLASAPRERVGQELLLLLGAPDAARGLSELIDLGLFEPAAPPGFRPDRPWLELRCGADIAPANRLARRGDDAARLAFLLRAWGVFSSGRITAYSWPHGVRETALRAAKLLDEALATVDAPAADRRELAWRAGEAFPALLTLGCAIEPDHPGWARWRRQWRRNPERYTNPTPLLSGTEIAEATGLEPGPELGRTVTALVRAQVRGEVRTRAGALAWLRRRC